MSELQSTDPTKNWRNVSNESIKDPAKAEHMAVVEDKWRTFTKKSAELGAQQRDSGTPFGTYAAGIHFENARDSRNFAGPEAVEATGQAYDQGDQDKLENPDLPPELPPTQEKAA